MGKLIFVLFVLTVLAVPPFDTLWVVLLCYTVLSLVGIIKLVLDDIYASTDKNGVVHVEALKEKFKEKNRY